MWQNRAVCSNVLVRMCSVCVCVRVCVWVCVCVRARECARVPAYGQRAAALLIAVMAEHL
jgi:hypothetical protein